MVKKKIVLVNTVYGTGSVGRITADLYQAVQEKGMTAAAAYGRGSVPEGIYAYKIGSRADFYGHVCYNFLRDGSGFGSAGRTERFLDWLEQEKPDLIYLHNLHGFYLQVEKLFTYIKERDIPVVWTLHDCWSFTGHCAYYDKNRCEKWKSGCGQCRYHRSAYPYALFCDNSAQNYTRKKQAFCGVKQLSLVTPSKWLAKEAGKSFLGEYPIRVIPNGIDLQQFCPADAAEGEGGSLSGPPKERREKDQIQTEHKKWEILGAANIWEERKGLACLEELAGIMPEDCHMTLIGLNNRQRRRILQSFLPQRVSAEGRTDSIAELAAAYRRADVFVNPTLEDVFSMTNLEALACGTPVITFPTGGSPETVRESCGIVTKARTAKDILEAVERIRKEKAAETGRYTAKACRSWALDFDKKERYGDYLALYQEML